MKQSTQRYIFGLFFLVLALLPVGAWVWWSRAIAAPQTERDAQSDISFQIAPGTSAVEIGQDLQQSKLIRSDTAWALWSRWLALREPEGGFQAGAYRLSPGQSLPEIAHQLWTGKVVQTSLTVPEGWSLRRMAKLFEAKGYFSADEFLQAATRIPRGQYPWLPTGLPHLEGFLYPDTYQFAAEQVTPEAVIQMMLDRFEQVALPLYQRHSGPRPGLREWVTLASIVEKEAVIPAERPRIAGVFAQRLQKNIPLGADPTVEYSLGIQQTADKPLTLAQVNTPSPYNTYLNPGLPPTPIASPGLASLRAALAPEKTNYLYFVARYDGTHVFSQTLAEHQAAQARIQGAPPQKPEKPE